MKPNIEIWPIASITPYDKNIKNHPPAQVKKIAESIKEFGWTQPIVVDGDGIIIAGHGRRLAALSLELKEVPVWIRDNLTSDQVRALRLVDNRVAEDGKVDFDIFRAELADLNFDLGDWFDAKELEFASEDMAEMVDGGFVDDINGAVDAQAAAARDKAADIATKAISIDKALGFKRIEGKDQIAVSRFQARIEHETGKTGADAFVAFAKSHQ